MIIKEIKDKRIWEEFLLKYDSKTFLQSWNCGNFNEVMGNKVWRIGVYSEDKLVLIAQTVLIKARRGSFLLLPHGPIGTDKEAFGLLFEEMKKIALKEKADFIRISPICERNKENESFFNDFGFRKAPIHMHPEASWKLDIIPAEEELLANMRKTTRYLIRQAEKNKEIEVYFEKNPEMIDKFNEIHQKVVKKHHFIPFSLKYFKEEFLSFLPDNQALLFFGKYKGEIIASSFVLFWSDIAFYHHAASSPKYSKIPIAYLLQWEAIKEAKKRGCKLYDFWGYVSPKEHPSHPWVGPTIFKMGFGGKAYNYLKTQDFPLSKKYYLTYIFESIRRIKRYGKT